MAGCGIKIFWRERDLLSLTGGIALKLTAGCGMKNGKSHVIDVTRRTDRDKYSNWGESGIEKTYVGPSL